MQGAFTTNYSVGGVIDEIKKVKLPEAIFPDVDTLNIISTKLSFAEVGTQSFDTPISSEMYLADVLVEIWDYANVNDMFSIKIGTRDIATDIYVAGFSKSLSQINHSGIIHKIAADEVVSITFTNGGGIKDVFITVTFAYKTVQPVT